MKLAYLLIGVFKIAVRSPREVRIPFVPVTHVCGLILNSILLCLSRIHHFENFPFFVSFASVAGADKNRRSRLQNLSRE